MKVKDFLVPLLFVVTALTGLFILVYLLPNTPQVGTAIGVKNVTVYASGLSDETQELVEDLRWKHYGLGTLFYVTEDIELYQPGGYKWTSIWFEDGVFYVETQDGTWFIEMKRKEE